MAATSNDNDMKKAAGRSVSVRTGIEGRQSLGTSASADLRSRALIVEGLVQKLFVSEFFR